MDRAALQTTLATRLVGRPNIAAAWLFGSVARGDDHPDSDVDLGLLLTRPPLAIADHCELAALAEELQAAIGRHVDLVALNDAHPELLHRVLRDGILLAEADHQHRVRFEVRARNEYFDMQPIWTAYRRSVLERL